MTAGCGPRVEVVPSDANFVMVPLDSERQATALVDGLYVKGS